jgi:hypothetical protein
MGSEAEMEEDTGVWYTNLSQLVLETDDEKDVP